MKYDVIFLRSGFGKPDSRMEKEILSLMNNGIRVYVIAWDRNAKYDKEHSVRLGQYDIPFYHIGIKSELAAGFKKNLTPMLKFNKKVFCILKQKKDNYSIIHASDFDTVMPAYLIKKKYNKKLIYDIYDYYVDSHHMPKLVSKMVKRIDTHVINFADTVILCNEKRLEQIYPAEPKRVEYIHNTPYDIQFEKKSSNEEKIKIVYVGGLIGKGRYIKELLDAVVNDNRFELFIGGYGELEDYIKKISEKHENIKYYGKLDYAEVLKLEGQADIMTALYDPSLKNHQYAAPNKFYEALMAGKPLIVAKNTYIDTIVERKQIGWILTETNENSLNNLKQILNEIYAQKDELLLKGAKMRKLYETNYRWKVMEERLVKIYKDLM